MGVTSGLSVRSFHVLHPTSYSSTGIRCHHVTHNALFVVLPASWLSWKHLKIRFWHRPTVQGELCPHQMTAGIGSSPTHNLWVNKKHVYFIHNTLKYSFFMVPTVYSMINNLNNWQINLKQFNNLLIKTYMSYLFEGAVIPGSFE